MAVKTTKKAKKATAKTKRITGEMLDEAVLLMTAGIAEMSKKMAKSRTETDAKIAESDAKIAKSRAEYDVKIAESDAKIAESRAETDRALQRLTDNVNLLTDKVKTLTDNVEFVNAAYGGIGRGFGELVELIVIPKIRLEMNRHEHDFKRSKANKKFRFSGEAPGRKDVVTEVDMFLYNGTETMAIEIKTSLSVQDVEKHIKQLKTLRKYEAETDLQGKKLYGAMVGVYVDYHARKFALKNGLYILEIIEEENRMKTAAPERPRSY